ncbi:MAG: hypothetical protein M3261_01385 [Thermoproteota archaeon]|nr:hypothetical protein [Thermoproteota archaeon]
MASVNVFVIRGQILIIVAIVPPHILEEEHLLEDEERLRKRLLNFSELKN